MTVSSGRVEVAPITDADLDAVGGYLHDNLNNLIPVPTWPGVMTGQWATKAPNHGFMLRDGERVVGAYVAYYSERLLAGRRERICNLASWSVHPKYRIHSVRLLKALLDQGGYHFTDLSPNRTVESVNARLKFRYLDTSVALIPHLPWPAVGGRIRISADPDTIARTLTGRDLELYRDHQHARATYHLIVTRGDESCYVMFRTRWYRGAARFGAVIYVSNQSLFRQAGRVFARHLLAHHGLLGTFAELRIVGARPRGAVVLPRPKNMLRRRRHAWLPRCYAERYRDMFAPKMYRSASLEPDQIDDLYSEISCVPGW